MIKSVIVTVMKINNAELLRLGTPKIKLKPLTKQEHILYYLQKHGETPARELDSAINGYGHFAELTRSLIVQKKITARLCSCKETTLYKVQI